MYRKFVKTALVICFAIAALLLVSGLLEISHANANVSGMDFLSLLPVLLVYSILIFTFVLTLLCVGFYFYARFRPEYQERTNKFYTILSFLFLLAAAFAFVNAQIREKQTESVQIETGNVDPQ